MNILALDDERLALKDLVEALEAALPDAKVHSFRTSAEALDFQKANAVDVAFLDIEMRGMSGLELAKRLKDCCGQTNIVFVTGYSRYAVDAFTLSASDYLLKPVSPQDILHALQQLRTPVHQADQGLRVQCFGNLDVFYHGKPIAFSRSKAKELFAFLVHKRGTSCTTREIGAVLFEDRPFSLSLSRQTQVIISAMIRSLNSVGARGIILRSYNNLSVDTSHIDCDYYRFLAWELEAINAYSGEYMSNYSWAEFVVGYLDSKLA